MSFDLGGGTASNESMSANFFYATFTQRRNRIGVRRGVIESSRSVAGVRSPALCLRRFENDLLQIAAAAHHDDDEIEFAIVVHQASANGSSRRYLFRDDDGVR